MHRDHDGMIFDRHVAARQNEATLLRLEIPWHSSGALYRKVGIKQYQNKTRYKKTPDFQSSYRSDPLFSI